MKTPFENETIITVDSGNPGKIVVLIVGVHGNEVCGVNALAKLFPSLEIIAGKVTFILGNPRAVEAGKRLTEQNLNRMFLSPELLSDEAKASYEFKRAQEMKPYIDEAEVTFDVHSSSTPNATPFIIAEPHTRWLASKFDVPISVAGFDEHEPGGTDYYANLKGKVGLCIECGYHPAPETEERARVAILTFLSEMSCIAPIAPRPLPEQKVLEVFHLYKTKVDFKPHRLYEDFEKVAKHTALGTDGDEPVYTPGDGYTLFVGPRNGSGQEAYLLAQDT